MPAILAAAAATALLATISAAPSAQSNMAGPQKYTAFAINISNTTPRAKASPVDIVITRWSTDDERDRLMSAFREKGQDGLLSELQKLPAVGGISTPGSLRYDIHFARQKEGAEKGKDIFLMTDRYITGFEAINRPRSIDYPFTLIQLQLDKDGKGVGKASIATKITQTDEHTIELEDFASQPVMLNDVHPSK